MLTHSLATHLGSVSISRSLRGADRTQLKEGGSLLPDRCISAWEHMAKALQPRMQTKMASSNFRPFIPPCLLDLSEAFVNPLWNNSVSSPHCHGFYPLQKWTLERIMSRPVPVESEAMSANGNPAGPKFELTLQLWCRNGHGPSWGTHRRSEPLHWASCGVRTQDTWEQRHTRII